MSASSTPAAEPMEVDDVPLVGSTSSEVPAAVTTVAGGTGDLEDDLFGDDDDADVGEVAKAAAEAHRAAEDKEAPSDAGADDLFGADDDDEDDEDAVKTTRRAKAGPAATPSAESEEEASEAASDGDADGAARRDLEHLEDGAPMGQGRGTPEPLQPDDEIRHADLGLPSLPLRRGADQWLARLPNFLSYRHQPFDSESFDPDEEDMDMKNRSEKEQVRVADPGLRSVIASTCTIRWRYDQERDEEGYRVRQSNSRIVRWSDGTLSLQLGDELYDITQTTDRVGNVGTAAAAASASQSQAVATQAPDMGSSQAVRQAQTRSAQPSTHIFSIHPSEGILLGEGPIAGTLGFRPTNTQSETHRRLARAVKQQRGARVRPQEFQAGQKDPELLKEEEEKRLRLRSAKEQKARNKERGIGNFEDFDLGVGRRTARFGRGAREVEDEDEGVEYEDEDAQDGFVVSDKEDGEGADSGSAMDVDEPDDLDVMEGKIEDAERSRGKKTADGDAAPAEPEDEAAAAARKAAARRRVIVDSDEE